MQDTFIDGYNLIFGCGLHPKPETEKPKMLEQARQRLIAELSAYIPTEHRNRITIIYDSKTRLGKSLPAPHDRK